MSKGATSEEKQKELYNDLSETEKYMFTLMDVSDANAKLHVSPLFPFSSNIVALTPLYI